MKKLAIFGISGYALEVADVAIAAGYTTIVLLSKDQGNINNDFTIHHESEVDELSKQGFVFAIGVGDSAIRKKIYLKNTQLTYPNLIHPSAIFGYEELNHFENKIGNIITAGVIMTNNIKVGNFGVYNLNCTVGHDCIIDDFVSIMPSVNVSGNVHLEEMSLLGVASVILQGNNNNKLIIGAGCIVGAQSLVSKNVLSGSTVFGVPARVIKK